jgi:hypothetical protein
MGLVAPVPGFAQAGVFENRPLGGLLNVEKSMPISRITENKPGNRA